MPPLTEFQVLNAPVGTHLGENHIEFLQKLGKPTWINVTGKDQSRSRAIITLLHGNEPSGLKAVHRILKEAILPATNLVVVVASVSAALHPPILSHRYLPGEQDFNRCFKLPFDTNQRKLANDLLERLAVLSPEAIVDTHNTSAHSEAFAVAVDTHIPTQLLAQMFTKKLVVIDQKLGTLIENTNGVSPLVTVEFGGFMDPRADVLAYESLHRFATVTHLFNTEPVDGQLLEHPLRLEIEPSHNIHYSSSVQDDADLTVINTIDQLNFQEVAVNTNIGWLGRKKLAPLSAVNARGEDLIHEYFHDVSGFLTTKAAMTMFMATTDPFVARNDCLLYFKPHAS